MKSGAVALVITLFSVAVLGFLGVSHMNGYHSRCLTETARAADCPQQSVAAFINFNFNTLKSFSTAVLTLALFLAAFLIILHTLKAAVSLSSNRNNYLQRQLEFAPIVSQNLRGFLALREKSPPRI